MFPCTSSAAISMQSDTKSAGRMVTLAQRIWEVNFESICTQLKPISNAL